MTKASVRAQVKEIQREVDRAGRREEDVLHLPAATKWFRVLRLIMVMLERGGAAPARLAPLREALAVLGPVAKVPTPMVRQAPGCRVNSVSTMALIAVGRWANSGQADALAFLWDGHAGALREAVEEDRRAAAGAAGAAGGARFGRKP
jgi:hypothetical protein